MKFIYQARTVQGERRSGTVDASSLETALNLLQKHGLFVTFLESAQTQKVWEKKISFLEIITRKDIVNFSRQLSIMFQSNVSLAESLETIANQERKQGFKDKIIKISREVKGGTSFSGALSKFPKLFSPFYISMVKSGEASGNLANSLNYLADHLEREYNLRASIVGAMIYPALVVMVMLAVMIVMMVFVIPNLTDMLQETNQELPWVTKLVISVSDFLRTKGWTLIIIIPLLGVLFHFGAKTKQGAGFLHRAYLKIPIIGKFLKMVYISTFAENLSTLIAGGLPIVQALEISGEVISNTVYKKVIKITRDEVERGQNISSVLDRFPEIFPPMFCQMVSVGEKTGTLDKSLLNVVNFYQKEVDRAIKSLLSVLEPLLIVFLGGGVAIIIAAVLLPMYQMTASV